MLLLKRRNGLSTMSASSWSLAAHDSYFDDDNDSESNTNRQTKKLVIHYEVFWLIWIVYEVGFNYCEDNWWRCK